MILDAGWVSNHRAFVIGERQLCPRDPNRQGAEMYWRSCRGKVETKLKNGPLKCREK
jgi:hypothetical protein